MALGDPTTAPPGPVASTDYTTGQLQAGYVFLDPRVGWVWQDSTGTISANDQNRYAASQTEMQKSQGGQLVQNPDGTWGFTMAYDTGPQALPPAGQNFPGWGWSEKQIYAAIEKAGGRQDLAGYTAMQTWDNAGNPITILGVSQADGKQGYINANGEVQWTSNYDIDARAEARLAAGRQQGAQRAPWETATGGQRDAFARLQSVFTDYGLGDLNQFAWDAVVNNDSQERILQNLRNTDVYKQRFPGMAARKTSGQSAMSEAEYIAYERQVKQMMRENGLPPSFFDHPDDFTNLIGNDVSVREVSTRVSELFNAAMQAPAEVRQVFNDYYGIDGTAALATYFLDPVRALPLLQEELNNAQVGGTARRFGYNISQDRADALTRIGVGASQAASGFQRIKQMDPLFHETITENQDFTAEGEGVNAQFGLSGDAATGLQTRLDQRTSQFGGGGGAGLSSGGVLGLQNER
jgi:hypothetical protein